MFPPFFMQKLTFNINSESPVPKFQQLADEIVDAINDKRFRVGDPLPSVNTIIKQSGLSRDTIVKSYNLLKRRGIIESYPQKGYFVTCNTGRIFLFLDTFKAYKEVLYDSFRKNVSKDFAIDLHFHHYDIDLFEKLITDSLGKYSKYVIMNFNHKRIKDIISLIDPSKLLIIDWGIDTPVGASSVIQNFDKSFESVLNSAATKLKKYTRFILIYPNYTYHPEVTLNAFMRFCKTQNVVSEVITHIENINPQKGDLYISVSDRALALLLDIVDEKNFIIGEDVGIISYNETPMKKYIQSGISVVSTDFKEMGKHVAQFVTSNETVNIEIPTELIIRKSI